MNSTDRAVKRILVVDDEPANLRLMRALLGALEYEAVCVGSAADALATIGPEIDLVLLDVMMPGIDGLETARRIRNDPRVSDVPIVMVTGLESRRDRLNAVEAGANDYVTKPVDLTELRVRMTSLLQMKEAQDALKKHRRELEETVLQRTAELRRTLDRVEQAHSMTHQAHLDTIQRLALAAEYRDHGTIAHLQRISRYCEAFARSLGLPEEEVETLRIASQMHDVGKIGIPDSILLKSGELNEEEREVMRQHPVIGARILEGSPSPLIQAARVIALTHHEKWDGSGYPYGIAGEQIPLHGRICAIADVFDALTSERHYKGSIDLETTVEMMLEERDRSFDPRLLDIFLENTTKVLSSIRHDGE